MNRLSPLQLAALMLCARCFSMMTYFPYSGSNTLIFMAAVVISAALQWLILLPASVICAKSGKGICGLAYARSRAAGIIVTLAFLLYFVWDVFITSGTFGYFMDNYFSNQISRVPALICAVGAAVYLGSLGSAPLGRCGGIIFCVFAFFTAIMLLSTVQQPDTANFHLAQRDIPKTLSGDISAELVRSRELVMTVPAGRRERLKAKGGAVISRRKACAARDTARVCGTGARRVCRCNGYAVFLSVLPVEFVGHRALRCGFHVGLDSARRGAPCRRSALHRAVHFTSLRRQSRQVGYPCISASARGCNVFPADKAQVERACLSA